MYGWRGPAWPSLHGKRARRSRVVARPSAFPHAGASGLPIFGGGLAGFERLASKKRSAVKASSPLKEKTNAV